MAAVTPVKSRPHHIPALLLGLTIILLLAHSVLAASNLTYDTDPLDASIYRAILRPPPPPLPPLPLPPRPPTTAIALQAGGGLFLGGLVTAVVLIALLFCVYQVIQQRRRDRRLPNHLNAPSVH